MLGPHLRPFRTLGGGGSRLLTFSYLGREESAFPAHVRGGTSRYELSTSNHALVSPKAGWVPDPQDAGTVTHTPVPGVPCPCLPSHLLVLLVAGRKTAGHRSELEVSAGQLVEEMHPGRGSVARGCPHGPGEGQLGGPGREPRCCAGRGRSGVCGAPGSRSPEGGGWRLGRERCSRRLSAAPGGHRRQCGVSSGPSCSALSRAPTCCLSRCRIFAQVRGIQGLGCAEHKIG